MQPRSSSPLLTARSSWEPRCAARASTSRTRSPPATASSATRPPPGLPIAEGPGSSAVRRRSPASWKAWSCAARPPNRPGAAPAARPSPPRPPCGAQHSLRSSPGALAGAGLFARTAADVWLSPAARASTKHTAVLGDASGVAERAAAYPDAPDALYLAAQLVSRPRHPWESERVLAHPHALLHAAAPGTAEPGSSRLALLARTPRSTPVAVLSDPHNLRTVIRLAAGAGVAVKQDLASCARRQGETSATSLHQQAAKRAYGVPG